MCVKNAAQGAPATRILQTRLLVPTPKLEIPQGAPASLGTSYQLALIAGTLGGARYSVGKARNRQNWE